MTGPHKGEMLAVKKIDMDKQTDSKMDEIRVHIQIIIEFPYSIVVFDLEKDATLKRVTSSKSPTIQNSICERQRTVGGVHHYGWRIDGIAPQICLPQLRDQGYRSSSNYP